MCGGLALKHAAGALPRLRGHQPFNYFLGALACMKDGGERGIRTLGRVSPTHAFQACSLNHSDISPL